MTAWNSTSTNTLNVLGCPADLWNSYNWGSFIWGSGTADLPTQTIHLVTPNNLRITPTEDELGFRVIHLVTPNNLKIVPTEDELGFRVVHLVTPGNLHLTPTEDELGFRVIHLVTPNNLHFNPTEDELGFRVVKLVTNSLALKAADAENIKTKLADTITLLEDMSAEYLTDSHNWDHLFLGGVANAHNRAAATNWTATTSSAVTWATAIAGSTVWS